MLACTTIIIESTSCNKLVYSIVKFRKKEGKKETERDIKQTKERNLIQFPTINKFPSTVKNHCFEINCFGAFNLLEEVQ